MTERVSNFIGGRWVEPRAGRFGERRNPAHRDEVVAEYALSGGEDVAEAVASAKAAFDPWRRTPAPRRGDVLFRAQALLLARKEEIARALTREEGKTLREARGEVQKAANVLEFIAGEGRRLNGETVPSELPSTFCYTLREPLGVVGVVTPWNFPVAIPVWKMAPALLCGNTVVFKPASFTPVTARMIVEVFAEAGVPAGALNMVVGPGGAVGDAIVGHPDVRAVSFTGSNEVGCRLYGDASRLLKRVQCEMGGKNPVVVSADADLDLAAAGTAEGAFGSTGQRCTATSRAIVELSVLGAFTERVVERARSLVVGDGMDEKTHVGPSVDDKQLETVLGYVAIGKKEGAEVLCGGGRAAGGALARGSFVEPTVFAGVRPQMRIAQEEIFGPVLSILAVPDFEEAMRVANGVRYGLTASIYTREVERVQRFVSEIETGIVHVNSATIGGEAQLPFGGSKATGIGPREQGRTAIDFYTEVKTVYVDYTGKKRETHVY